MTDPSETRMLLYPWLLPVFLRVSLTAGAEDTVSSNMGADEYPGRHAGLIQMSGVKTEVHILTFVLINFVLAIQTVQLSITQSVFVHTHASLTAETGLPATWQPETLQMEEKATEKVRRSFPVYFDSTSRRCGRHSHRLHRRSGSETRACCSHT